MRVALLHLELSGGPEEDNLANIRYAVRMAAAYGAQWIVTPETAVQGYFFAEKWGNVPPVQPDRTLDAIRQLAVKYELTVFLGCAEQDAVTGKYYNSCLVIGPNGQIIGRHRKLQAHSGAEAWSEKGETLDPVSCQDAKAGVLICADSRYVHHAQTLKNKGAEVIVVPAAWPSGECGPGDCWEQCSGATGLPVWVCNQTGNKEKLDFSQAESAVVVNGKTQLAYSGLEPAVLLFDWQDNRLASSRFRIIAV